MERTNNTRKGGNQVSLDDSLTARGICEKPSGRLTVISPTTESPLKPEPYWDGTKILGSIAPQYFVPGIRTDPKDHS